MTTMIIFDRYMINSVIYNTIQLYHDFDLFEPQRSCKNNFNILDQVSRCNMTTTVALIGLHFLSYSDTFIVNIQRLMPVKGQKIPGLI